MNQFVTEVTRGAGSAFTENGAVSYASFGTELMDQFGKAGSYMNRPILDVFVDQAKLFSENPLDSLKFAFYLRMITRKTKLFAGKDTETVQRGQGLKDESLKRLTWFAVYHPELFYSNAWLIPMVGSWKDLWVLMSMNNAIDRKRLYGLIAEGIKDERNVDLVKKYLPRIRSTKKCTTDWAKNTNAFAKEFAAYVGWTPKQYREFKSTGKAHEFQRYICKGLYSKIDWNTIPGKALLNLVSSKFLANHNLSDSYLNWIMAQPVAKFNGYPYELGMKLPKDNWSSRNTNLSPILKHTLDKQFKNLIQTAKSDNGAIKGNVWCALDTSGSMTCPINDRGVTAFDVCIALGIYFSELNEGAFHNNVIMFDNTSRVKQLKGEFTDKWMDIVRSNTAWGSTNFQSVIDEIVRIRKQNPNIPLTDYPETLLVVSDMQFNPSDSWRYESGAERTNYEAAKAKLAKVFPAEFVENFKIVWWQVNGSRTTDFPSTMDCGGTYVFSGFDGSVISFLLGGEQTKDGKAPDMQDIIDTALGQEVLQFVKA
jgi:hypothetical protein